MHLPHSCCKTLSDSTFLYTLQQRITVPWSCTDGYPRWNQNKKGSQPKPFLDFFFFVLSRSASSHTGLGGGYLRPHGAGRVQNRACVMLDKRGRLNPWSYREEQIAFDGTAYLCLNYEFVVRYIWFRVRKNLLQCDAHVSLLLVSLEIPCAKCIHKTPRCFNDIKHQKIYN